MTTVSRDTLVARRDQIQANLVAAREKARDLEIAIRQGEGALLLLNDLLAEPVDDPASEIDNLA